MRTAIVKLSLAAALALPSAGWAQAPQVLLVAMLPAAPVVDGALGEWGAGAWTRVKVKPAVDKTERAKLGLDGEDRNAAGTLEVEVKAGVAKGRLYLALRWPDDAADTEYKGWEWRGTRYVEGKARDDMLAVRFHMSGEFDRSMLMLGEYKVDVWLWSAARSNPAGLAEDMTHLVSGRMQEEAAEYELPGRGTVYIKKRPDEGEPVYRLLRAPKGNEGERLPSFETTGTASGSKADVVAKGVWKAGHWHLELSRLLDTGQADDVAFVPGGRLLAQIAVFNHGYAEHKSVSEPLLLDLGAVK